MGKNINKRERCHPAFDRSRGNWITASLTVRPVSPSSLKNVTVPVARRCRGRPKSTDKSLNVKYGTREANRKKPAHNRKLPVADATAQPLSCSASDNCAECGLRDPRKTTKRAKLVNWVQCDKCQFWYHECCISNVPSKSQADYVCVRCAQCLRLFTVAVVMCLFSLGVCVCRVSHRCCNLIYIYLLLVCC